jgi:plasmid maintenance system antidote protein VapI
MAGNGEEFLKPLGIGQADAAHRLGISLNRLNEIVLAEGMHVGFREYFRVGP